MHDEISLLIKILQEEKSIYEKIFELSKKETKTIQKGDLTSLEKITRQQEELLSKSEKLQKQRQSVIMKIKQKQNKDDITLNSLIECIEEPWQQEEIMKIQKELKRITTQQTLINRTNDILLKSNMKYVQFAISMLQESLIADSYNSKNLNPNIGSSSFIDQKA